VPSASYTRLVKGLQRYEPAAPENYLQARADMREVADHFTEPDDVTCRSEPIAGVPAEWVEPPGARPDATLVYLHGGGFYMGSIDTYRHFVARVAKVCAIQTLHIDYRLAPEHPFPAALDDAVAVVQTLLEAHPDGRNVFLAGDSAGGGLTVSTLLRLREAKRPLPVAAALLSPWVDLTLSGATYRDCRDRDPVLKAQWTPDIVSLYTRHVDPKHPYVSPVFADLSGLPPLLIQVGTHEILLDDSRELAARARKAGVDVTLEIWDEMIHVWQYYAEWIPEAQRALEGIGAFFQAQIPTRP